MNRRANRPQKRLVYLGCEGKSEVAYGQVINGWVRDHQLAIYLRVESLASAGDPLMRVNRAIQWIKNHEKRKENFHLKAILLDADQRDEDPERASQAHPLFGWVLQQPSGWCPLSVFSRKSLIDSGSMINIDNQHNLFVIVEFTKNSVIPYAITLDWFFCIFE